MEAGFQPASEGGNWASELGGGAAGDWWDGPVTLNNCILYYNTAANGPDYGDEWSPSLLNSCCTTPLPTNGVGNITNAPLFIDVAGGNLRLRSSSPCINAGHNAYAPGPTDLDGKPRIVRGTVDIGAYEYQGPAPGSWTQKTNMPAPASTCASCVLDGILYVMGGHDDKPSTHALANVWAYDPRTDSWTNKAPLPIARHFLGQCAVAVDGMLYLVGGTGPGMPGALMLPVAVYNPRTDTWTNGANMPTGRGNLAACAVDGIIYAIGGALNTSTQTAADGKIYLAGGASKEPLVNPDVVFYRELDVLDPQGGVTPQILRLTCESTNRVRLVWQGEAGECYGVESRPNVGTGPWTRLPFSSGTNSVLATNGVVEATCSMPSADTKRFFRVLETN